MELIPKMANTLVAAVGVFLLLPLLLIPLPLFRRIFRLVLRVFRARLRSLAFACRAKSAAF